MTASELAAAFSAGDFVVASEEAIVDRLRVLLGRGLVQCDGGCWSLRRPSEGEGQPEASQRPPTQPTIPNGEIGRARGSCQAVFGEASNPSDEIRRAFGRLLCAMERVGSGGALSAVGVRKTGLGRMRKLVAKRAGQVELLKLISEARMPRSLTARLTGLLNWARELEAEKGQLQAEIDARGGVAEVWVLRTLSGEGVNAMAVNARNSACWQLLDSSGKPLRSWLPYRPIREQALRCRGYCEVRAVRCARAMILFGGSGAEFARVEAVVDPVRAQVPEET
jgi:hypothetical protein